MSAGKSVSVLADVYWACLQVPNPVSDKEQYTVNLSNLSSKAVDALKELGINVLSNAENRPDEGNYITCKSNYAITAFNKEGEEIAKDFRIANGSKAKAIVSTYDWTFKGKSGVSPSLKKLTITDLVEYNPESEEEEAL